VELLLESNTEKFRKTSMFILGLEPTIPVLGRSKTIRTFDYLASEVD